MKNKAVRLGVLVVLIPALLVGWSLYVRSTNHKSNQLFNDARAHSLPKKGDSILIVAPHPDDETLALSGLMQKAKANGAKVSVLFLTNGDAFSFGADIRNHQGYTTPSEMVKYGEDRQNEAVAALKQIGVTDLCFAGLPDRGLTKMRKNGKLYTATNTNATSVPYKDACFKDLKYRYSEINLALKDYLKNNNFSAIYVTGDEDLHSDHSESAVYMRDAINAVQNKPLVYYYIVHKREYPAPKGINESLNLEPPPQLTGVKLERIDLTSQEIATKKRMINSYQSQLSVPQIGSLLRSFIRQNELVYTK